MDITKLDMNAAGNLGAWLDILHPVSEQPIGLRIRILGSNADGMLALRDKFLHELREAQRTARPAAETQALEKRFADETLAAAVKAWEHQKAGATDWHAGLLLEGQILQCDTKVVLQVLNRPGFEWLRQQVVDGITDAGMFLRELADAGAN